MPVDVLQQKIGKKGIDLWKKAKGIDNTPVEPYTERKSISTEHTITIRKMPFIPDPRYSQSKEREYDDHRQIREDVSITQRKPYPQEHQIGLPRHRMN